jgi:hypothetical protein
LADAKEHDKGLAEFHHAVAEFGHRRISNVVQDGFPLSQE